jgi:hypothetical protein
MKWRNASHERTPIVKSSSTRWWVGVFIKKKKERTVRWWWTEERHWVGHMHTRIHTHTACAHTHTCAYTHIYINVHPRTHTHERTRIHICSPTGPRTFTCTLRESTSAHHIHNRIWTHTHIYAHNHIYTRSACTHDANIHSLLHTHAADTPLNTQTIRVNAFDPLVSEKSMQSRILFGKVLEGQVLRNPQIEQIRSARTPVVIGFHEEELNLPNHSTTANTTQGCEETRNKTHTHTHTHIHTHSLTLPHSHVHTHTHTHIHSLSLTLAHSHVHTHTHTHTHIHIHIHTLTMRRRYCTSTGEYEAPNSVAIGSADVFTSA